MKLRDGDAYLSISPPMRATPKPSAGPPCQTSNSGLFFAASRRATVSPDERRTNFVVTPVFFVNAVSSRYTKLR